MDNEVMKSVPSVHQGRRCGVCPRACCIAQGEVGFCQARGNVDGVITCVNYGKITSMALDPVEKKPFALWHAGAHVLSVGSFGCNLACPFCQNADISQAGIEDIRSKAMEPEEVVKMALDERDRGCIGIAFTYNEPLIGYEFVRDVGRLAHNAGLLNVVVTNGMINAKPFAEVLPLIDAINVDLKGFSSRFYSFCGFDGLGAVKRTIVAAAGCNTCHLEVTSLIVPGESDPDEMEAAAAWLSSIDQGIPYHITQYHAAYDMHRTAPLPDSEVRAYADRARAYLKNVFIGNM